MKNLFFLGVAISLLLLGGCGNSYPISIESGDITWNPNLKTNMQVVVFDEENGDLMFQEVSDETEENTLDTLIVAYDTEDFQSDKIGLASYVQMSINQLKDLGSFELSDEKAEKTSIGEHEAILKTYKIKDNEKELHVAQEFIELGNKSIVMISFTSDEISHVKTFVKELPSLQIN